MPLLWVRQEWDESLSDGTSPNIETDYQVVTDNIEYPILSARLDLLAKLAATGAMVFGNLPLSDIKIERLRASKCFRGKCTYGMRAKPEDGKFDFTMDSRPESKRLFVALATIGAFARPGHGVSTVTEILKHNRDGEPTGTDIYVPVKTYNVPVWWSTNRFVPGQPSTEYQSLQAYLDMLETLEGTVNSVYFDFTARGLIFRFQPGECLLASTRLSQQAGDLWQIDFELKKKRNYIDPLLSGWAGVPVTIEGWDEVDYTEDTVVDGSNQKLSPTPVGGIVKRTYFRSNHNKLKVPAPP